jgi:hypothetical protein
MFCAFPIFCVHVNCGTGTLHYVHAVHYTHFSESHMFSIVSVCMLFPIHGIVFSFWSYFQDLCTLYLFAVSLVLNRWCLRACVCIWVCVCRYLALQLAHPPSAFSCWLGYLACSSFELTSPPTNSHWHVPYTEDSSIAKPLTTPDNPNRELCHIAMPWEGFEPTIPVFDRSKSMCALDNAASVIGTCWTALR